MLETAYTMAMETVFNWLADSVNLDEECRFRAADAAVLATFDKKLSDRSKACPGHTVGKESSL